MNLKYFVLITLVLVASCSGSGGQTGIDESNKNNGGIASSSVTISEAKANEISIINQKFNSNEKYKLTNEELQVLLDEGALTEEEKAELVSMFNNQ